MFSLNATQGFAKIVKYWPSRRYGLLYYLESSEVTRDNVKHTQKVTLAYILLLKKTTSTSVSRDILLQENRGRQVLSLRPKAPAKMEMSDSKKLFERGKVNVKHPSSVIR